MKKLTLALVVLAPLLFAGAPRSGQAPQHPKPDKRDAPPPTQQQKPRGTPPPAQPDGGRKGSSDDGRDED